MSVNLRDRVFTNTGGVVQNATVQAILVTGGGTDVGTSSVVQATTTTDANGMWKFVALPDAGAGNWYDVKITNGNQVMWRYGNIQASIAQVLFPTAIAVAGLLTANAGLTVAGGSTTLTGNVSITTANLVVGNQAGLAEIHLNGYGVGATTWPANSGLGFNIPTLAYFQDQGVAGGNGGTLILGAGQGWFAGLKGFLTDGTSNTTGDIAIATRAVNTDASLTERFRIVGTTGAASFTGSLGAVGTISAPVFANNGGVIAATGSARFANNAFISFRNAANSGDLSIGCDTSNNLLLNGFSGTSTATAGSNGDVPAQVQGYIVVLLNGSQKKIPYYNP